MQFLKNDKLKTIRSDWPGNPVVDSEFQYPDRSFRPEWTTVLKWALTPNPQRKEKKADKWRPNVKMGNGYLKGDEDFIIWLGHATFLIQLDGVRMITDPVFFNLGWLKRLIPLPYDMQELRGIDYVLLSHDHRDHCDEKSLKLITQHNQVTILTALNMSDIIGSWTGNSPIVEAGWYQQYSIPDHEIEIIYLPAQHWCRRGLTDFNRRLWGSFMIKTSKHCIYFGADSATGAHFREIGNLFPEIDIAMLGIGAYKPRFMMKDNHTSPPEAMEAFFQLGAKKMIPMHYATYDLSNEPISEPYRRVQECFAEKNAGEQLLLPAVNEVIYL